MGATTFRVKPRVTGKNDRSGRGKLSDVSELIYDWNTVYARSMKPAGRALLNDESLRDGLQSPSVRDPSIEEKIEILHLMEQVGINMLDIGLPGAGPRAVAHCEALAREIGRARLKIKPNCAARTHRERHPSHRRNRSAHRSAD